jgi:hypothetical protein
MTIDPNYEEALHGLIPDEAMRLVEAASSRSLHLRVTGSLAVRLHSSEHAPLLDAMGRRRFRDIDFWGYAKEQKQLEHLFAADEYVADPEIMRAHEWGVKRLIFEHPQTRIKIDVFMDELVMAHTIGFKGRLDLDYPTTDLTYLLLSKVQIHEITENDMIDMIVLLAEHDFGKGNRELIDSATIVEVMRGDWGFCYTTLENLTKCDAALDRYPMLPADVVQRVRARLGALRDQIVSAPKTTRWKMRSRVGTRARWYEEVGDVNR